MRAIQEWFDEYGESHRNRFNKIVHWICVPAIGFSIVGLLWSIPVAASWRSVSPLLNFGTLFVAASVVYYFVLSPSLALGMTVISAAILALLLWIETLPVPVWQVAASIFVVAWIGQFIGHVIEGRRPSFFKDVQFLLIGPIWLLAAVDRSLRVTY